ncbi:MAG: hypothetical protein ACKOOI_13980 [Pirellula sp.]
MTSPVPNSFFPKTAGIFLLLCLILGGAVPANAGFVLITDFNTNTNGQTITGANGWADYTFDSGYGTWTILSNTPSDNIYGSRSDSINVAGALGVRLTGALDYTSGLSATNPGHFQVALVSRNVNQHAIADFTFWEFKPTTPGTDVSVFKPFSFISPGFDYTDVIQFWIAGNGNPSSVAPGEMYVNKLETSDSLSSVPEPSSLLIATSMLGIGGLRRIFKKRKKVTLG